MRFSSLALPALAANLAAALPRPQDIDIDMVIAAPDPTYTEIPGSTAQTVTYDPTAIFAEATAAASSLDIAVTNVATATAANVKRSACDVQPTGVSAYALETDSASAFSADPRWASLASAAPVPSGFVQTQQNAKGANSAYGYLGYRNLQSYDTQACADICTKTFGCMAFNVYVERDPSVEPGTGCRNPSSVIYAKCALWGSPLSPDSATNTGQMRADFQVAVAGSNAYQNNSLVIPAGFSMGDTLGNAAINAPYDSQGYNTYMGATIFTKGTFSIQACADYCSAQTAYNVKHPAKDGIPPKICNFFNTYMLYLNNASTPQGQYCSLYTEAWESSYATNTGQYRGSDRYFVAFSYTIKNSTSLAPKHASGDINGAAYQARQDMTYYPSQLTSTFMPYCFSLLSYTNPVTTITPTTTITPLATTTATVTSTVAAQKVKRDDLADFSGSDIPTSLLVPWVLNLTATADLNKRATATAPAVLTKYPAVVQASACSMIVTQQTVTSTITAAPVTVTVATQTTTATSVINVAATPVARSGLVQIKNQNSAYSGQYINWNHGAFGILTVQSDVAKADSFSIDSNNHFVYGTSSFAMNPKSNAVGSGAYTADTMLMTSLMSSINSDVYPNPVVAVDSLTGLILFSFTKPGDDRNLLQVCPYSTATAYGISVFGTGPYLVLGSTLHDSCELVQLKFVSV